MGLILICLFVSQSALTVSNYHLVSYEERESVQPLLNMSDACFCPWNTLRNQVVC